MLAVVGAGVLKDDLNKEAARKALFFGVDPSSNPTLGGMASCERHEHLALRHHQGKRGVAAGRHLTW